MLTCLNAAKTKFDAKIPWVLEFDKGEGWALPILQVSKHDFPEFVEQIINIAYSDIRRKVPHVYSAVIVSPKRHYFS